MVGHGEMRIAEWKRREAVEPGGLLLAKQRVGWRSHGKGDGLEVGDPEEAGEHGEDADENDEGAVADAVRVVGVNVGGDGGEGGGVEEAEAPGPAALDEANAVGFGRDVSAEEGEGGDEQREDKEAADAQVVHGGWVWLSRRRKPGHAEGGKLRHRRSDALQLIRRWRGR